MSEGREQLPPLQQPYEQPDSGPIGRFLGTVMRKMGLTKPYDPVPYQEAVVKEIEDYNAWLAAEAVYHAEERVRQEEFEASSPIDIQFTADDNIRASGEFIEENLKPLEDEPHKTFQWFARMCIAMGQGTFLIDDVAESADYHRKTIILTASRMDKVLPDRAFHFDRNANPPTLAFGNLALSSAVRTPDQLPEKRNQSAQTDAEINKNKIDLTDQNHAIIDNGQHEFYLALESAETILASRVVESLRVCNGGTKSGSEVAKLAWARMTTAERQIFTPDARSARLKDGKSFLTEPTLSILRGLTNRLGLTLEPAGDSFKINSKDLKIQYYADALEEGTITKDRQLRPIWPPGVAIEKLTPGQLASYINTARQYIERAQKGSPIEDEEAIVMLDFIMSRTGHWAVREASEQDDRYPDGAMGRLHRYLRANFHGYSMARRERVIGGHSLRAGPAGRIRLVSGRLPSESNWTLGGNPTDNDTTRRA